MRKSDIVVGGKYLFNPAGKNRYDAFSGQETIEVEVSFIHTARYQKGDLEVFTEDSKGTLEQTVHWSELKPLKTK